MQPILPDGTLVGFQWGGHRFTLAQPKTPTEREEFARIEGVIGGGHYRDSRVIRARMRGCWTYRVQFVWRDSRLFVPKHGMKDKSARKP